MARGGVGWRLLNVVVGQTPPLNSAPLFSPGSSSAGSSDFSQYREPLSSPVRRCTGFCYQLIRVEASGSRDRTFEQDDRILPHLELTDRFPLPWVGCVWALGVSTKPGGNLQVRTRSARIPGPSGPISSGPGGPLSHVDPRHSTPLQAATCPDSRARTVPSNLSEPCQLPRPLRSIIGASAGLGALSSSTYERIAGFSISPAAWMKARP